MIDQNKQTRRNEFWFWGRKLKSNPGFFVIQGVPIKHRRLSEFFQTRRPELALTHLPAFCSSANLLCFPDLAPSLEKHHKDSNFARYADQNFTNYGTDRLGRADSFKTYSNNRNLPVDSFRRYSRAPLVTTTNSKNNASNGNVVGQGFNGYATGSTGRSGEFAKSDSVKAGRIFSGKLERDFLGKVREGNQTERERKSGCESLLE